MWTPADITALPTQNDLILANLAIRVTEEELKNAWIALAEAQRRVTDLENDLVERRAWIAPIRRLTLDVLSLIFEFCGEDEWRTPLRISEVSRQWRSLVLATPRAWAFLDLKDFDDEDHVIHRFFMYSGQRPLHIFLPDSIPTPLLYNIGKQLKCLSVLDMDTFPEDAVFPVLDRLAIRSDDMDIEISYFNDTRFPSLCHLICDPYLYFRDVSSGVSSWSFPPLQTLSLVMTNNLSWTNLLTACSNTLISLKFQFSDYFSLQNSLILLPMLKCLEIKYWHKVSRPLHLKTPVLECYLESTRGESNYTPQIDTAAVKQMRLDYMPTLASFPLLELLQLEKESHVSALFSQLALDDALSPKLREVELALATEGLTRDLEKELEKVNQHRPVPVKLVYISHSARDLPYEITNSPCGKDMPCSSDR